MARICIDLDGVIAQLKQDGQTYADVAPVPGAVERMRSLKAAGHYLILLTARHMKTCGANPGLVMARVGKITLEWLDRHGIPYDEIHFSKPWAEVYIDDNALRFTEWAGIASDGGNLPSSSESKHDAK
jgi:capsule biosynthesis phosphatase